MLTKTILSAWIAAGLMLSAQTAEAQSAPAQAANTLAAQRLVHYADLDLTSAKGQATLAARLRSAARAVCDTSYGAHSLNEVMGSRRCYRSALQSAQREAASLTNLRIGSR